MAKGYIIFTEQVNEPDGMAEYSAKAAATIFSVGGVPLAAGAPVEVLEGEWHGTQTVILEFPSVEEAQAWYRSEEYQTVIGGRFAAAESNAAIFGGLDLA